MIHEEAKQIRVPPSARNDEGGDFSGLRLKADTSYITGQIRQEYSWRLNLAAFRPPPIRIRVHLLAAPFSVVLNIDFGNQLYLSAFFEIYKVFTLLNTFAALKTQKFGKILLTFKTCC